MQKEIVILFLYLIVITIFGLGIHFILKKKLWKPANYSTITIIGIISILILYQLRVLIVCLSSKSMENMGNSNTIFKLMGSNDSPVGPVNLSDPINYGRNMKSNDYANDNHAKTCKASELRELQVLVTASGQQLEDAKNAYDVLTNIYSVINGANSTETDILNTLDIEMANLKTKLKV
jgi:hypothetical protein